MTNIFMTSVFMTSEFMTKITEPKNGSVEKFFLIVLEDVCIFPV